MRRHQRSAAAAHHGDALRLDSYREADALVLRPVGELSALTYTDLRDGLFKSAAQEPPVMVVDLAGLRADSAGVLTVFPAVWMRISDWPGVPMVLVVAHEPLSTLVQRSNITRFIPTYRSVAEALEAIGSAPLRRRCQISLSCELDCGRRVRRVVEQACDNWGVPELTLNATLVAGELAENLVRHARTEGWLRLELHNGRLTVAVADLNPEPPRLRPPHERQAGGRGLVLVAELSKAWGHARRLNQRGKVVWAVLAVATR